MTSTGCVLIHLFATDESHETDVHRHLDLARTVLSDRLVHAVALDDSGEGVSGVWVAANEAPEAVREVADRSPLSARSRWRLAGIDGSLLDGSSSPQNVYASIVLDPAEPPVPFDDPSVTQIVRDQYSWFFPILGQRHVASSWLTHDGVRTAGAITAFTAGSAHEARWFGRLDPWRRIARGVVVRCPPRIFASHATPSGPGTQRLGHFACGKPHSQGEPYP